MTGSIIIKSNPVLRYEQYIASVVPEGAGYAELEYQDFRAETRSDGGLYSCTFKLYGRSTLLKEMFQNGLGRHVEAWGYGLQQIFEGQIDEMVYNLPPDSYTISLANMANKMYMRTDYNGDGTVDRSTTLEDSVSQARYGIKEQILSGGTNTGLTAADQAVQAYIDLTSVPKPEADLNGGQGDTEYIEVFARGYIDTLNWRAYNQTSSTGNQGASSEIVDIIGTHTAGYAPYLRLPFDSSTTDTVSSLAPSTATGALIYSSEFVKSGQAIQLAEATTNYAVNPSFENNVTDGWTENAVTASQEADAKFGSSCVKLVGIDGGNNDSFLYAIITDFSDGDEVTFSVYGKVDTLFTPADSRGLKLAVYEYDGNDYNNNASSSAIDAAGEWQFKSVTLTARTGHVQFLVRLYLGDERSSVSVKWDGVQIEGKAYPTPYCDGSLGTGHAWTGTAHASTSTRTATDLQYTIDLPSQFSISLNLSPLTLPSEISADGYVFDWYGDSDNYLALIYDASADVVSLVWTGDGTESTIDDVDLTRFQEYEYDITFDGTTLTLYRDGASVGTTTPTAFTTTPSTLYMGENYSSGEQLNGWPDEFVIREYSVVSTSVGQFVARTSIDPNATSVAKEYDADRRAYDIVSNIARLGDSSNNRWLTYMRGHNATQAVGREFVFEAASPAVAQ